MDEPASYIFITRREAEPIFMLPRGQSTLTFWLMTTFTYVKET